jgi:hypothetical protein
MRRGYGLSCTNHIFGKGSWEQWFVSRGGAACLRGGLLPTRRERDEQFANVQRAIRQLERQGCSAGGQVAATRSATRVIAKAARARQVRYVVMDEPAESGLRGLTSRTVTSTVRRRLAQRAVLELVATGSRGAQRHTQRCATGAGHEHRCPPRAQHGPFPRVPHRP